ARDVFRRTKCGCLGCDRSGMVIYGLLIVHSNAEFPAFIERPHQHSRCHSLLVVHHRLLNGFVYGAPDFRMAQPLSLNRESLKWKRLWGELSQPRLQQLDCLRPRRQSILDHVIESTEKRIIEYLQMVGGSNYQTMGLVTFNHL